MNVQHLLASIIVGHGFSENLNHLLEFSGDPLSLLDLEKGERPDPVLPGAMVFAGAVISIATDGNGGVKIVRRGQILDRVNLKLLNCPDLTRSVEEFIADNLALGAKQKLKSSLAAETENLCASLAEELEILQHDIRREFPKGTARQHVDIVLREFPDESGNNYNLVINRRIATDPVPDAVGRIFVARKKNLEQAQTNIRAKTDEREDLERQIADLQRVLPVMDQKNRRLINGLDRDELRATLGGDFVGITVNEQNQPIVTIRKEVNEELAELPEQAKLRLLAEDLEGNSLPENLREALGIDAAIKAATKAMGAPKPTLEIEPTPKSPAPEVQASESPAPETTAANAGSARLESYVKLL